jgi:hypothetical protein
MQYARLRHADLEIGSGVVEGAVRHLIGVRLDGPGMRWGRDRAEAVLHLRCVLVNLSKHPRAMSCDSSGSLGSDGTASAWAGHQPSVACGLGGRRLEAPIPRPPVFRREGPSALIRPDDVRHAGPVGERRSGQPPVRCEGGAARWRRP